MSKLLQNIVTGLIRHGLSSAGAALVADGVLTSSQSTEISGGVLAILAVGWSIFDKRAKDRKLSDVGLKGLF